jgi:hypothetical protein
LVRSKQELLNAIRARDRVSRAVESKTAELEASLVGFSAQIMDLREQLSVKEHVSEALWNIVYPDPISFGGMITSLHCISLFACAIDVPQLMC